jgi:hypothetical protein
MKALGGIASLLLGLFLAFNVAYRAGADGLIVGGGGEISFNRGHDRQLLRVTDSIAVLVDQSTAQELPVVDVTRAAFPFTVLCGTYEPDGFTRSLEAARAKFGEKLSVSPHPVQGERDRVMVAMSVQEAAQLLSPMSTCNESCLTFNAAFLVLFALLGLVAPVAWWRSRRE